MSDQPSGTPPTGGNLQFERAERTGPATGAACVVCKQPITASYYEINGHITCQRCRSRIVTERNRGSSGGRFAKALALGFGAALVGAGLYFAIAALTGYEFGLVAVVVGLMVGSAVRKGSNGRGGWRYQVLAMFLTYTAVVATDSSIIARELSKELRARRDSAQVHVDSAPVTASTVATSAARAEGVRPDATPANSRPHPGALALIVAAVVLVALAFAAPIMIGVSSPLHLLIAGFALYEAWKLNKGSALRITGPYQVSTAPGAPA